MQPDAIVSPVEAEAVRKVWRRILPFTFALLLFAQIDKHNIAFAGLTMRQDLGLSATVFGLAVSIFYVGFIIFEIPSNVVMARVGARIWLSRIAITLGLASVATMFATGPQSLLVIRFLLGVAEAGMVPGLLLYFTYWFPRAYRARANGWLLVSMPVAGVVTAILSGAILDLNGALGLAGWQWLFLLLGTPSILMGIAGAWYLTDRPDRARWLSDPEKSALTASLAEARPQAAATTQAKGLGWAHALFSRDVMFLAIANLGVFITLAVLTSWAPQIVRTVVPNESFTLFGFIAALPALAAAITIPVWARRSDLKNERKWHIVIATAFSVGGLLLAMSTEIPWLKLTGLIMCSMGAYGGYGVFWSLVTQVLPERHRPAGIAMIHAAGTAGAMLSPVVVGYLRDATGSFSAGLLFAAVMLTISLVLLALVGERGPAAALAKDAHQGAH